jgi:nucleotide-binding universal stress UspA family protein
MNTIAHRILVPFDGSQSSEAGLSEAIGLARTLPASLVLLHVMEDFPLKVGIASLHAYEETRTKVAERARALLENAATRVAEHGVAVETRVRDARDQPVHEAIVAEVESSGCGLIVMGTYGHRSARRGDLGADAEMVLRTSPVPVLMVRSG